MKLPGIPFPVFEKHGAYYRIVNRKSWVRLTSVSDGLGALEEFCKNIELTPVIPTAMPVVIEEYKKTHLPTLTPAVRKEHDRMFDKIAHEFADFTVEGVKPKDCLDFLSLFNTSASARQAYKYRMSAFFSWAVIQEYRETNPLSEVKVKGPIRKKTPWTDALFIEVRKRLNPMLQCYHDLEYLLWQRTTDVRLLERKQINNGMIRFTPSKTANSSGKSLDILINADIDRVLNRAKEISLEMSRKHKFMSQYVIHTKTGDKYTRSGVYSAYMRADADIHGGKLVGLSPKSIRPYVTTKAEKMGINMRELQTRLAHASRSTTEGYIQHHSVPVSEVNFPLPLEKC